MRERLTRQQVIDVIEGRNSTDVPLFFHKWWGMGLEETYGSALHEMAAPYPDDILGVFYAGPGDIDSYLENPEYRWGYKDYSNAESHSIGERKVLLEDWSELEQFLAGFPSSHEPGIFDEPKRQAEAAPADLYKLGCFWCLFHERFWNIRGMENLMMDYYDAMDKLKILGRRLLDYYKEIVDQFAELGYDGIFTSDDLGHQTGPMMSPDTFHELYFPLYKEFAEYVHSKGMHLFLHSCGDNSLLMEDLCQAGVDVFHPIQKGCMDMEDTVEKYGKRISFLAGFDVQYMICNGTAEEVRQEVRDIKAIFQKHGGRLLMAAGNGIMSDTPLENIDAMLDEMSKGYA